MVFGLDDVAFGAIASGALQGGSSLLGGMFGASGQAATNAQAMQNAIYMQQEQERFQMEMSNTAYRRAMGDMKAAGLNPILAANLGGASTPGGGGVPPNLGNPGAFMQQGITSAGNAAATAATTKVALTQAQKDSSQIDLNKSSTDYTNANKVLTDNLAVKAQQDTASSAAQARAADAAARAHDSNVTLNNAQAANAAVQNTILQHDIGTAAARKGLAERELQDRTRFGQGTWGDLSSAATRGAATALEGAGKLGEGAWGAYSRNIGQPFANAVGRVIDKFRSGENPGLTIDVNPKRR